MYSSLRKFDLGVASFGALLGAWITLSASPIIATTVPLIFGLAGAISAGLIIKADPTKEPNRERLRIVGDSLKYFSLSCLTLIAILVPLKPIIKTYHNRTNSIVDLSIHQNPIDVILLKAKLEYIGADQADIKYILSKPIPKNIGELDTLVSRLPQSRRPEWPPLITEIPSLRQGGT